MTRVRRALPWLLALSLASAVPAQSAADLEGVLNQRMGTLEGQPLDQIWKALTDLGTTDSDAMDQALEKVLARPDLPARGRLLCSALRIQGEEPDTAALMEGLVELLKSSEEDVVRGAATILNEDGFQLTDAETKQQAAESLLALAQSSQRSPAVRLDSAVACHRLGDGATRRAAQDEVRAFLGSSDTTLRTQGALALAEIGDMGSARPVLERLSELPGDDGRLARAYLKQEDLKDYYGTMLERQRRYLSQQDSQKSTGDILQDPALARVQRVIEMIERDHLEGRVFDRDELLEAALAGMLRSLDQHSAYLPPKIFEDFDQDLSGEYGGIGAYVGKDPADDLFTITRPIYSGPAYHAGLMSDDKVVRIDDWPTLGQELEDIIDRLKGRPGTEVKLYVWRKGMDPSLIDRPTEEIAVRIERAQITIPPVQYEMLPGDIGLVELTTFSRVASTELERVLRDLRARGMKGLIFDLRNNSGGYLDEAANVADLFLPKGLKVVSTEGRHPSDQDTRTTRREALVPEDIPMVVLINRFSASASEIVAGALQDHKRAQLVGQLSFGKGSVQTLLVVDGERDDSFVDENSNRRWDNWETLTKDWNGNGKFDFAPHVKMTTARYLLPSGRSIHRELDDEGNVTSAGGVKPDIPMRARRWAQWRLEEIVRIQSERTIREWVEKNFDSHAEVFSELARGDEDDVSRYPGFDELYASLDTILPDQDVRFLLRRELRRRVQDSRGAAFPAGEYQEDLQLQAAIKALLAARNVELDSIPQYAKTFDEVDEDGRLTNQSLPISKERTALQAEPLKEAMDLIAHARKGDGGLSKDGLDRLQALLDSVAKGEKN